MCVHNAGEHALNFIYSLDESKVIGGVNKAPGVDILYFNGFFV